MGKGQKKKKSKKISPWGSGGWMEPGRSPEPDEVPKTSQDEAPGRSRGREGARVEKALTTPWGRHPGDN